MTEKSEKRVRCLTCAKCGVTSEEDPSVTFHRFPLPSVHGSLKPKVWATFCFPNEDWSSDQSLYKLHKQYKMLCSRHFDDSSYTGTDRKRLNRFAIPTEAQNILAQLRDKVLHPPMDLEVTAPPAVTPQCASMSVEPSTSAIKPQSLKLIKKSCKEGIIKEIGVNSLAELTPRKRKLYNRCRKNLSEILRLCKNLKNVKKCRRHVLESLHGDDAVNDIIKSKLSSPFYLLLQSQLKNVSSKLAGRRWSLEDKVLALSLYKKSTSCYKLLRRLFSLPSINYSLKALLNIDDLKSQYDGKISKLSSEVRQLKAENTKKKKINSELEKSYEYMSEKYEETQKQLDTVLKEQKEYKDTIIQLENKIKNIQCASRISSVVI